MNTENYKSLSELPHRLRAQLAGWAARWRDYRASPRETNLALRRGLLYVGIVIVIVLAVFLGVRWLTGWITPGGLGALADQPSPTATLYVACTNPNCRTFDTVIKPLDFKDWPLRCSKCGGLTVYRATQCPTCRQWYARAPGGPVGCPFCAEKARKAEPPPVQKPSQRSDDEEDPWR